MPPSTFGSTTARASPTSLKELQTPWRASTETTTSPRTSFRGIIQARHTGRHDFVFRFEQVELADPEGVETPCTKVRCVEEREQWHSDSRQLQRVRSEWRRLDEELISALSTEQHHVVMIAGLPFCECRWPLGGGDATGSFIKHRLTAVRELLDNTQEA